MLIISLYLACGSWTKVKREMLARFKEAACNLLTLGVGIQPSEDGPFHIFILDSVSWIRRSIGKSASSSCDNSGGSWIVDSGAGVTDIALFTSTTCWWLRAPRLAEMLGLVLMVVVGLAQLWECV